MFILFVINYVFFFLDDVINNGYIVDNITGDFILHASVENKGEPAYGTKLFIVHPRALSYIALKEKNVRHVLIFFERVKNQFRLL